MILSVITYEEMDILLMKYISPFYEIIGGVLAVVIIFLAYMLVIHPLIRRLR